MKKGFTLVEIIISISIILIVGVSTTFFIFNNKNNKELEGITKEILEAANLYANIEKDESGNIYLNEVRNGKKGIKILLTNLVSKGYIDESLEKQVKELTNEDNYYVMLLDGSDESIDYCEDGSILTLASWIDEDKNKDIYLCNNEYTSKESSSSCPTFIDELRGFDYDSNGNEISCGNNLPKITLLNEITSSEYYVYEHNTSQYNSVYGDGGATYATTEFCYISSKSNGLHKRLDSNNNETYYYRGDVKDNYVKIINIAGDEVPYLYRIVSFTEEDVKLISTETYYYSEGSDYYNELDILVHTDAVYTEFLTKEEVMYAGAYEYDIEFPSKYNKVFYYMIVNTWIAEDGATKLDSSNGYLGVYNGAWGINEGYSNYLVGIVADTSDFGSDFYGNARSTIILTYSPKMDIVSGKGTKDSPYLIDFSKYS